MPSPARRSKRRPRPFTPFTWGGAGLLASAAFAVALFMTGCKDEGKESATRATAHASSLAALAARDVAEVREGLPTGAAQLASLYAGGADPKADLGAVRNALRRVRHGVPSLNVAKSTFFAMADEKGVALRNDLEQDAMAGRDLTQGFPALKGVASGGLVTTTGTFPDTPGGASASDRPADKDWIAAAPIRAGGDGGPAPVAGMLVTGWSYRYFARHLQESLLRELKEQAQQAGASGKLPIVYVAVFDGGGVFPAPGTPPINEQALKDAGLVAKTAAGPWQAVLTLTGRDFGCAAARIPEMAPDTGVVVLRSEI